MYGNDDYLYSLNDEDYEVLVRTWGRVSWLPIIIFLICMCVDNFTLIVTCRIRLSFDYSKLYLYFINII